MHDITFPLRLRCALLAPALVVFLAFWLLPMAALVQVSGAGHGLDTYRAMLTNERYMRSLVATVVLSCVVTLVPWRSLSAPVYCSRGENSPAKKCWWRC